MKILYDFIVCTIATFFFGILFRVPRRAILASSLLGGASYALYDLCSTRLHSPMAGYFAGTFLIGVSSEILARVSKKPATVFVIPGIVPLVPGLGLYDTMLYLLQHKNTLAVRTGVQTVLAIAEMAMALVISTMFFGQIGRWSTKAFRRRERQ